ncbi:beta-lactamase hydrolase domain-containing protein [Rhodanobacter sp. Col0626]|uniref:beta-lactamase hydrolase domain-containing protein n=1 Tax=Rhodanobacter sp. Col0626 TaxID=3415679 RepID=UPI003CFB695E
MPNLKWTFLLALLLGFSGVLFIAWRSPTGAASQAGIVKLSGDVWVAAQMTPVQLAALPRNGIRAVIDLRPDGEVSGQPSSSVMAKAAQANGLGFGYVPVPHGDIPQASVEQLGHLLTESARPILLYCHSGRRAARTWALAEASRQGGLEPAAILAAVRSSGQSADDLATEITARVSARPVRS